MKENIECFSRGVYFYKYDREQALAKLLGELRA